MEETDIVKDTFANCEVREVNGKLDQTGYYSIL